MLVCVDWKKKEKVFVFVGLWWDWMDIVLSGCKHGKVDNSWSLQSLSENDSKLYVDFEFRGKPNCKHLKKTYWSTSCSQKKLKKNPTYSRRWCQLHGSGDVEQVIVETIIWFKMQ